MDARVKEKNSSQTTSRTIRKNSHPLGFIINSKKMTVSLSESKENDIKAIFKEVKIKKKVVIRTLAKLIGKLEAAYPGIHHGRLYLWHLHQSKKHSFKES